MYALKKGVCKRGINIKSPLDRSNVEIRLCIFPTLADRLIKDNDKCMLL